MAKLSRWAIKNLVTFVVILAILLIGTWLRIELSRLGTEKVGIADKKKLLEYLNDDLQRQSEAMEAKLVEWGRLRQAEIEFAKAELAKIDDKIRNKSEEWAKKQKELETLENEEKTAIARRDEAKTRHKELKKKIKWYDKPLYGARENSHNRYNTYLKAEMAVKTTETAANAAIMARAILDKTLGSSPIKDLKEQRRKKEADLAAAHSLKSEEAGWETKKQQMIDHIKQKESEIDSLEKKVERDPKQRFLGAVRSHLPTATWILIGIILTPIAIKVVFYYGLAPLAARFPPIRLVENVDVVSIPQARDSAVSLPIDISDGSEILIHPDYLQSSDQSAMKRTQWLLNRSLPFSSIASRMTFLTRIRPPESHTTRVFVSSQKDPFGEIGAISLPEGASMVVHPRSLAAVVKRLDSPVRITRHWRVSSLHAWLTLQLRFLVFHGPCDLILKGCRGVRAESPNPESPRIINQVSTIGFSANLDYHNTRCETFISYLRGKEDLFNDLFGGERGIFVYEEMPAGGRKTGLTGRGLEGVVDAVLKVFGI